MRRFLLLAIFLVTISGCAWYNGRLDAAGKCASDPGCLERVQNISKAGKVVGEATGIPWAGAVAGGAVAAMMLFFARKKKDK